MENEQLLRFALAGLSNMCGATVTNPIDVIKIRMQLDQELSADGGRGVAALRSRYYRGMMQGMRTLMADEGFLSLYKGLLPSLLREAVYSTIRLGAYEPFKVMLGATDTAHTPLYIKICAGAMSGVIGSSIATPTDLVKVRLQAERLASGQEPRYRGIASAFRCILAEEGVRGLYTGLGPTVQRAAILTATQIPAYDHTKHTLLNLGWMQEGAALHVVSAMSAGFLSALTTSPVDVVKTRIMNQPKTAEGLPTLYRSTLDCFVQTTRSEGLLGLYKGFFPNWMRIGPHTIVTFFVFEQLRRLVGIAPV